MKENKTPSVLGYSLIELLLTMGILSIVLMAMVQMFGNVAKNQQHVTAMGDISSMDILVQIIIGNDTACSNSFPQLSPVSSRKYNLAGGNPSITSIPAGAPGSVIFTAGMKQNGYTVTSASFSSGTAQGNYSCGASVCDYVLTNFDYEANVSSGAPVQRKFPVMVVVKRSGAAPGVGTIVGCSSGSSSSIPSGAVMAFNLAGGGCPPGWSPLDGTGGLPDARSRMIIGADNPTLPPGSTGGAPQVQLKVANLPNHTHPIYNKNSSSGGGGVISVGTGGTHRDDPSWVSDSCNGCNDTAFSVLNPYLAFTYCQKI